MSRPPNTDARRAQIVAALLPVIAKSGYEKATIQAIAAQAGLAPGLIHYHFKTKRDILVTLIETLARAAATRFEALTGTATDPHERLRAYLQARLGLGDGAAPDLVAAWVMIGAEAVRQAEVRAVYSQVVAQELASLTLLIKQALRSQQRDTRHAKPIAAALLAMMGGAFQLASAAPGILPVGYAFQAAWDFANARMAAAARRPVVQSAI